MSWADAPAIGGGIAGAVLTAIGLVLSFNRFLLGDRAAMTSLQTEITTLREELAEERGARRQDQADVADRIADLEVKYDEQRREKHRMVNEVTKAQLLLGVVIALAERCTCGALITVTDLMDRVGDELGVKRIDVADGSVPPSG